MADNAVALRGQPHELVTRFLSSLDCFCYCVDYRHRSFALYPMAHRTDYAYRQLAEGDAVILVAQAARVHLGEHAVAALVPLLVLGLGWTVRWVLRGFKSA